MKNIFNCFGKTKSNKNSTILDKPMASQPALKSECVLCRRRLHQFVCPTCSKPEVGIRNFNDPARRPLGQRGAALITHTMHIKGLVTAQHISTFLSNLKILKSKGIFWTDAFQVNRVTSEVKRKGFEGICEVKSIESLMDDYLKNKNTYINEPRKRKILNHIIFENKSNSGKPSFATDYLRVIALYLFGGLYIDTTIHFLPSNTIQNELTYLKRVDYSGVKFNFDTYSSITDHDVSKSLKKAIYSICGDLQVEDSDIFFLYFNKESVLCELFLLFASDIRFREESDSLKKTHDLLLRERDRFKNEEAAYLSSSSCIPNGSSLARMWVAGRFNDYKDYICRQIGRIYRSTESLPSRFMKPTLDLCTTP